LADEKLVPWDRQIQLYPVSMHTHLARVKPDLLPIAENQVESTAEFINP
jgi:hypothetical protein